MPLSRLVPPVPSEASFLTDLPSWLSRHTPRFWIGHPELARDHRSQGKSILHHQLSDLQPSTIKPLTAALDWAPSCWRGTTWVDANIGVKRVPPYIYDTFFTAQKIQKPKKFENTNPFKTFSWKTGLLLHTHRFCSTLFRTSTCYSQVTHRGTGLGTQLLARHHMSRCKHWSQEDITTPLLQHIFQPPTFCAQVTHRDTGLGTQCGRGTT